MITNLRKKSKISQIATSASRSTSAYLQVGVVNANRLFVGGMSEGVRLDA